MDTMNHTQQRKRRPAVTMPGHALMLTMRHCAQDRRDASRMAHLSRLTTIKPRVRQLALAGLLREGRK